MSYYVTNDNSFLDIKNAHLRVTGNVHTDVMKLGAVEFAPSQSTVAGTVNFTNVTTGVTTSSNLSVGGTLSLGTVEVVATTHTLANTTALGNETPHTIEFSNVTTGIVTTANVEIGGELTVTGNVAVTGTGALTVPVGTTVQRPSTPANGMFRYNSTIGYMEAYTATGWGVIATPPTITSFDTPVVASSAVTTTVITVAGSGFDAVTNIQLRGDDGTNYDVADFVFTDSTEVKFKIGTLASGQGANRPFKVVATNGAGLSATSTTTLGLGSVTWSSPAASSINEFTIGVSTSLTLNATDGVGGSGVTYSLHSGTYLSGVAISGSTITGATNAAENTTTSVTIRATDNADSSIFSDRTFTLKAVPDGLYPFAAGVPFTFTSILTLNHVYSRIGPVYGNFNQGLLPAWAQDQTPRYLDIITQGFQLWTVPKTGTYTIKAIGARGGQAGGSGGGQGAYTQGNFYFTKGTKLNFVVGIKGEDGQNATSGGMGAYPNYAGGSGGGASWVLSENKATLYAVAGGGGGSNGRSSNAANYGTGAGTSQAASTTRVGTYYSRYNPGGGASWDTDGNGTAVSRGKRISNGGMGGESGHAQGSRNGGFGGGGGNAATQGGGGAGYGGGNCSDYNVSPGAFGGTSRNNGSSISFGTSTDTNGSIIVTLNA